MNKDHMKTLLLGVVAGAVVMLIVVFASGWVVTSNSAKAQGQVMATSAVLDRLAPIAVAQFLQDPNRVESLKALKNLDSYGMNNRSDYVQKQGWATMPGEKKPDIQVASECVKRLMEIQL